MTWRGQLQGVAKKADEDSQKPQARSQTEAAEERDGDSADDEAESINDEDDKQAAESLAAREIQVDGSDEDADEDADGVAGSTLDLSSIVQQYTAQPTKLSKLNMLKIFQTSPTSEIMRFASPCKCFGTALCKLSSGTRVQPSWMASNVLSWMPWSSRTLARPTKTSPSLPCCSTSKSTT